MDPLTALSVAGTIVQFVEFGSKLFSDARELYRSTEGSLAINVELELVVTDLRALVFKLQHSGIWNNADVTHCTAEREQVQEQKQQTAFQSICSEVLKIAEELIAKLNDLKISGSTNRKWQTLQQLIKGAWSKREIANMTERLSSLRETIETRILLSIRESVDVHSIQLSARLDILDKQTQQIITSLIESSTHVSQEVTNTLTQIVNRLEAVNEDQHIRTRQEIIQECYKGGGVREITVGIEMLNVSAAEELALRTSIQTRIIESLKYPEMSNRYENVEEAYPKTFEWIFQNSTSNQLPWSDFSQWLKADGGLYWISGKAGSGKSTLMKHIQDDVRTIQLLRQWPQSLGLADTSLCLATFYFWNSGTPIQKSQSGMLRALLVQVLERHPDLVPHVFPSIWAKLYSSLTKGTIVASIDSWSLRQLMTAFQRITEQTSIPLKLCFFIDGLDEFDGDHDEIIELFSEAVLKDRSNIKVCVSSRPWVVFEDNFKANPSLRLQDLTFADIENYVNGKFNRSKLYMQLAARDPLSAPVMIQEIVEKADGVFLWVRIVVKSLLDGIRNLDSIAELWARLRLLPRELKPLYHHLLGLIEPVYLIWASKVFQILRVSQELSHSPFGNFSIQALSGVSALTIMDLYLGINKDIDSQDLDPISKATSFTDIQTQLTARCAGLLEVSPEKSQTALSKDCLIRYLHRTVRDFLEVDDIWLDLLSYTSKTDFDPYFSMMKSYALSLKIECHNQTKDGVDVDMMNRIAANIIIYAYHADAKSATDISWVEILDDVDEMMDFYAYGRFHWSNRFVQNIEYITPISSLLHFAALFSLTGYVRMKLQHEPSSADEIATALLKYLLLVKVSQIKDSCRQFSGGRRVNLPETRWIELASLLMQQHDGDPNAGSPGKSPWEMFLEVVLTSADTNGKTISASIGMPFLPLVKLFLLSRASPRTCLPNNTGQDISLTNLVDRDLLPRFPREASCFLSMIKLAQERGFQEINHIYDGYYVKENSKDPDDDSQDEDERGNRRTWNEHESYVVEGRISTKRGRTVQVEDTENTKYRVTSKRRR